MCSQPPPTPSNQYRTNPGSGHRRTGQPRAPRRRPSSQITVLKRHFRPQTTDNSTTSFCGHLFGADAFRQMKPTAVLVNTARAVPSSTSPTPLRTGEIFAAGLDVYEHEPRIEAALLDLDN